MTEPTRSELEAASALLREVTGFHEHPDDCDGLALCIREAQKRERERCAAIVDRHAYAIDNGGNTYVRSRECVLAANAIRAGEPSDG